MDKLIDNRNVPPFRWADEAFVHKVGDNLLVSGDRNICKPTDLLIAYEQLVDPPHIQLANCDTDAKLTAFVENFGPVNGTFATSMTTEYPVEKLLPEASTAYAGTDVHHYFAEVERASIKTRFPYEQKGVVQNLGELRTERMLLRTAIDLMRKLIDPVLRTLAGPEAIDGLVALLRALPDGTRGWLTQFEREQAELRDGELGQIQWRWSPADQDYLETLAISASDATSRRSPGYSSSAGPLMGDPHTLSKNALISLLNAFPLSLQWHGDAPIEVPPYELHHGIRPLLFAMLRRDLLLDRRIRMCGRKGCSNYFMVSRIDKLCCSIPCSVVAASNKRYETKIKPAREKARKKSLQDARPASKLKSRRSRTNAK